MVGKRLVNTGGAAAFDPIQNFETVAYTGNGGTQKITGYIRKGAAFNGSSSLIDTSISNSILPVSSAWSVSVFFYANSNIGGDIVLSLEDTTINGWSIYVAWNGSTNVIYPAVNGVSPSGSYGSVANNTWTNVVLTFDGSSTMKMYQDGSLIDTYTSVSISSPTTNLRMGKGGFGANWDGKIDQVRIFNAELNLTQVGQLADEEYGDAENSVTDFFGNGSAVALYQLDEDANDTGVTIGSGQSGDFDGSDSMLEDIHQIGYDNSISMWLNVDNTIPVDTYYGLWSQGITTGYAGIRYKRNSGNNYTIEAFIRLGNDYIYRRNTSTTWNPGWNHFVFLVNSTTGFDFYLNGNNGNFSNWFVAGTFTNVNFSNQTPVYLGKYTTTTTTFKGQMDDVRFYSDLLTTTEIGYLASNNTTNIAAIGNFVAHYKLDGNANDSQGSNNATWSGTEAYSDPAKLVYNGTPTNVNFLGMAFQPDMVWLKDRDTAYPHYIYDSVRGALKGIRPSATEAESTNIGVTSFNTNGFTLDSNAGANQLNSPNVAWCWKAGGAAVSNTDGSITSQVSANTDAGFSIVKYSGNGTTGTTVGHGLISAPELIITKGLTTTYNWSVCTSLFPNGYLELNTTSVFNSNSSRYITAGASTNSLTDYVQFNQNNVSHIQYNFHSVDGYQRLGTYNGINSTDVKVYTDSNGDGTGTGAFQPRFVMVKAYNDTGNWAVWDYVRDGSNPTYNILLPSLANAEVTGNIYGVQFDSDGFTVKGYVGGNDTTNKSGASYIYLAIA